MELEITTPRSILTEVWTIELFAQGGKINGRWGGGWIQHWSGAVLLGQKDIENVCIVETGNRFKRSVSVFVNRIIESTI